jgi:acyl dehydratase
MIEMTDVGGLAQRIGEEIAVGDWFEITQARITQFAEATEDRQWIHVDPERAARESPFGATIAHGFLTLSLVSVLLRRAITIAGQRMALNYGANRVRFITPVTAGSRIRARFVPLSVDEAGGGVQVVWQITVELEGAARPCAVVEWVVRYFVGQAA